VSCWFEKWLCSKKIAKPGSGRTTAPGDGGYEHFFQGIEK